MAIRLFILTILFGLFSTILVAQTIPKTEEEARKELAKRGLTEEEVKEALIAEGINIEDLESLTAAEIARMEQIIQQLENSKKPEVSEKSNSTPKPSEPKPLENLQEEIPVVEEDEIVQEEMVREIMEEAPIYGQNLFRDNSIQLFRDSDEIRVPESYVLGPGDEISISIWGSSHIEETHVISKQGFISFNERNQRISLKGLTLEQAREKLQSRYALVYRFSNGEFEVGLNFSRTVRIAIFGEVLSPGTVVIPAVNSAFNALVAANGPADQGSVRNIKLIRKNGDVKILDVYELMSDPTISQDYQIDNDDMIYVPLAEKVVNIQGAVRRPFKYELKSDEKLKNLIRFAGGLQVNAYKKLIQITRFVDGKQVVMDVNLRDLLEKNEDLELFDGDDVNIKSIDSDIENIVTVGGEVVNSGIYERTNNMTLVDLINLAEITDKTYLELAYLVRRNPDQTISIQKLKLKEILDNPASSTNLVLQDGDKITIWPKSRFAELTSISISGAVRFPEEFEYDFDETMTVADVIERAGGLRRDASKIGIIYRKDPLIENTLQYIKINVAEALANESSNQNIILQSFDRLEILSNNNFMEESFVEIKGAVKNPSQFQYGENMTVKDVLILAGGFKFAAATNKIEVSRVIMADNQPTKTTIANIEMDRDLNTLSVDNDEFQLMPYDIIAVRYQRGFELQQNVQIEGEVNFPGPYSLVKENENIFDLVKRAGGLTDEAFAEGATIYRNEDELGYIILRLDEVLENQNSKFNYILKDGDVLNIPKQQDFVSIEGATNADKVFNNEFLSSNNGIIVAFHSNKNAKFYIDYYAGGLSDKASKNLIYVQHPNGEIEQTRRILFWTKYPKVRKGSKISIGSKPPPEPRDIGDDRNNNTDWTKVLTDGVTQAMSILTLIVLIQRLDN